LALPWALYIDCVAAHDAAPISSVLVGSGLIQVGTKLRTEVERVRQLEGEPPKSVPSVPATATAESPGARGADAAGGANATVWLQGVESLARGTEASTEASIAGDRASREVWAALLQGGGKLTSWATGRAGVPLQVGVLLLPVAIVLAGVGMCSAVRCDRSVWRPLFRTTSSSSPGRSHGGGTSTFAGIMHPTTSGASEKSQSAGVTRTRSSSSSGSSQPRWTASRNVNYPQCHTHVPEDSS